ncbi:torsin-1B isoform X2 [Zootermopsis nevadensis]|uniref:torsin-1B isoform X2 n=1 Tax=Zootermopsis nevadensis TaxID=136037 RepID=UPI000B8EB784|nr:torsin-1B isoform X2 [Zootermopsis nevadensis]
MGDIKIMPDEQKLVYLLIILIQISSITSFEPFTVISASILAGSAIYGGYNKYVCHFNECCDSSWIPYNFTMLETSLQEHLFGQHLAYNIVVRALKAHIREHSSPKKALAFSFHGMSGSGKTFVSQFIINSLYKLGLQSKYAHFFAGRSNFPMESKVDTYKMELTELIRGKVTECERSLFVFDEVDKIPKGVLDAVKPFLDYHEQINGVDFRKAIFIFLSNTGSQVIVERLMKMWENGTKRGDIQLGDFENLIRTGAFNEKGGLHKSETIENHLIDHYVPFLPLEEVHVRQCIEAEFHRRGKRFPHEEHIKEVLRYLTFGPEPHKLFSNSGCKRIIPKVAAVMELLDI